MDSIEDGPVTPEVIKKETLEWGFREHYSDGSSCVRHWSGLTTWLGGESANATSENVA
jgi:hypothetical protein